VIENSKIGKNVSVRIEIPGIMGRGPSTEIVETNDKQYSDRAESIKNCDAMISHDIIFQDIPPQYL